MDANDGGGNPRPKKYKVIPKDLRQPRQMQLNLLAQRAYNDKKANNGKLPRNYYSSIMTPVAAITAPLQITYDDVRNELRKIETKEKNAANNAPTIGLPMLNVIDESSSSAESSTVSTIAAESSSSAESSTSPVSAEASTVVESSVTAESSAVTVARNRGGRPLGSTNARKRAALDDKAKATNQVVTEYSKIKAQKTREGVDHVEKGTLTGLIEQAKAAFPLVGQNFTVSKQTVSARLKSNNLEVWHRGTPSPVLSVEPILIACITQAYEMNSPWKVKDCKDAMNQLIEGTPIAAQIIAKRMREGTYDPDKPLLGRGWWRRFKKRNKELVKTCVGRKFARNRANHCTYAAFTKMYDQTFDTMIKSGNAELLPEPIHVDKDGNEVENIFEGYGHAVTIKITHPENIFVMDETGDNTHGKDDKNSGGQKIVAPTGVVPKEEVGVKDSHFTVVPIHNLCEELVMIVIIFKGEQLKLSWCFGLDVFAEEEGFGPGKRYPGGPSITVNGKEVPCFYAASKKASMTSTILTAVFEEMDHRGITTRTDHMTPMAIVDGHCSRLGLDFVGYINGVDLEDKSISTVEQIENAEPRWLVSFGVPYGTSDWQIHDDHAMNGTFKGHLYEEKSELTRKKRAAGLDGEMEKHEIVLVVGKAAQKSFAVTQYAKSATAACGWNPPTKAPLDNPEILQSAPEDVKQARAQILSQRNTPLSGTTSNALMQPTERNIFEQGSGLMAGSEAVINAANTLNYTGTVGNLFQLSQTVSLRNTGRQRHMDELTASRPDADTLKQRYKQANRLTSSEVFSHGDGEIGIELFQEMIRRAEKREAKEKAAKEKKKAGKAELLTQVRQVRAKLSSNRNKIECLNVAELKVLCKYKKKANDPAMPTKKADLLARYKKNKNNPSPTSSPQNSDNEEDENESGNESSGDESSSNESSDDKSSSNESDDESSSDAYEE